MIQTAVECRRWEMRGLVGEPVHAGEKCKGVAMTPSRSRRRVTCGMRLFSKIEDCSLVCMV